MPNRSFPQKAPQPGAFLLIRLAAGQVLGVCLSVLLLLPPLAAARETASVRVQHVVDGDSVVLADQRQVRLIGINAPEFGKEGNSNEPLAVEARDRLRALVESKTVQLLTEHEDHDHYGRQLAHLQLSDGTDAETVLLREGLAIAIAIPPNIDQLSRYLQLEAEARQTHRGLWGNAYFQPIRSDAVDAQHTGFHFVRGQITHVGRSPKYIYLDMGKDFALRIRQADWQQYFHERPEAWRGRRLVARGWISAQNGRLRMGIGHPAMLERQP